MHRKYKHAGTYNSLVRDGFRAREYEDTEAFAKLWADEEFHYMMLDFFPLVDNLKLRIYRPGMQPKSEE